MKWLSLVRLAALSFLLPLLCASQTIPPGSSGFFQGSSSSAVTFDKLSAFVDNKRLFVFSGEFHPWRIPAGQAAWRDVLQKMKAAGFNAVSVYLHWGVTEGKQGSLDFNYYRSHSDFYQVANEVGIFVIVRPGPYINAETIGGGLPGWLTNIAATARSNATDYFNAWTPYIAATAKAAAPFQYPNGPIIAVQVENEFSPQSDAKKAANMVQLSAALRNNGINKVPLTCNDVSINGNWVGGTGMVDFYQWDSYPNGFKCSNPTSWSQVSSSLNQQHMTISPNEPWATAEFQGGSFDPWGGSGYQKCSQLINEQFANVFYKNNIASGIRWQNFYMTFGGTNWGNLAEPTVYTSYDYGAPIREDRTLSPKYDELKLQALFSHASTDLLTAVVNATGTTFTANTNVFTTHLVGANNTGFYVVRQTTNSNTATQNFQLSVMSGSTSLTIPQFGGQISLAGRESKIIVTNYKFGSSTLQYSTAEVMTWTTIDGIDYIVLYVLSGQTAEIVVANPSASAVTVTGSTSIVAKVSSGTTVVTGSPTGISVVRFGSTAVIVADKKTASSLWNPRLSQPAGKNFDVAPDVPSTIIIGPYLVRNATISGSTLQLFGDINATTPIQIIAPKSVTALTWNGQNVAIQTSAIGTKSGSLPFTLPNVTLPSLTGSGSTWQCLDSLPEIQLGFNDSNWVTASKTTTARPLKPYAGQFVVYADEYGFHQGNTLYRGHFTGSATSILLSVQGGFNFGYSAWINNIFLGSSQGTNQYTTSIDSTNVTWTLPTSALTSGDNVVTVVFDQTGLEEDFSANDAFKTPRGIRGYQLNGGTFSHWQVIGNLGGESFADTVRGPYNEGGLYVERIGAHLPGFSATGWNSGTACNPLQGISHAGIMAYLTTFNLNLPAGADIPLALKFTLSATSNYRTLIYINGWQFGRVLNGVQNGPQDTFPLPQGILNPNGANTLLVTIWSLDASGAKMTQLDLINTAAVQSSREFVPGGVVVSPTFQQVRG